MTRAFDSLKVVIRLHPYVFGVLFLIMAIGIITLRSVLIHDPYSPIPDLYDDSQSSYPHVVMALGYSLFVLFLGVVFNVHDRSSWLFHLPISERTFLVVPFTLIFVYGAVLHQLVPLGDFSTGESMVFFGAPILGFLVIKNSRSILTGVLKSSVFAILLFFLWVTLLLKWSVRQELYQAEIFY
ncbi:MAG: hypothetical protein V4760_08985, partial [Bdellovibrionota bacterium]